MKHVTVCSNGFKNTAAVLTSEGGLSWRVQPKVSEAARALAASFDYHIMTSCVAHRRVVSMSDKMFSSFARPLPKKLIRKFLEQGRDWDATLRHLMGDAAYTLSRLRTAAVGFVGNTMCMYTGCLTSTKYQLVPAAPKEPMCANALHNAFLYLLLGENVRVFKLPRGRYFFQQN